MDETKHVREILQKLETENQSLRAMLSFILPHLENCAHNDDYIAFEFCEKFSRHIEAFKNATEETRTQHHVSEGQL